VLGVWINPQSENQQVGELKKMITRYAETEHTVVVPVPGAWLQGSHHRPRKAGGLVLIGLGADPYRNGLADQNLARELNQGGLATLEIDLLDSEEREDPTTAYDSSLLTERWTAITHWLRYASPYSGWNLGLYASGVPAAGALMAAARNPEDVQAVVTRNGRTDLAESWLPLVEAPTLLLVDRMDEELTETNRRAVAHMDSAWKLVELIKQPAAGVNQPIRLANQANSLARTWFLRNLRPGDSWE
jgi:hypothetical protein